MRSSEPYSVPGPIFTTSPGIRLDLLHDVVAVALPAEQGEQDVEYRRR